MSVQLDVTIDDLDVGTMRSVRVANGDGAQRVLLVRTSTGVACAVADAGALTARRCAALVRLAQL